MGARAKEVPVDQGNEAVIGVTAFGPHIPTVELLSPGVPRGGGTTEGDLQFVRVSLRLRPWLMHNSLVFRTKKR